ncbi:MAG: 4Fe-4S dicluster domain-containing protein [Chloroflexi bacterium]|nr:4Fe-4S dicluster domain-containing protein [Chloroflexota bacterium]
MEQKLRSEARALLEQGKVDYIFGYEPGSLKFTTTPLLTRDKNDVDRLVVNPFIVNNLAKFLTELKGRVGIVVKGCDSRSLVSLIQDNKVARGNVVILGVPCEGLIDLSKVEKLVGRERDELDDILREGDKVFVTVDGKKREFPIADVAFDKCLACELPTPKEYDILLGAPTSPIGQKDAGYTAIDNLKGKIPQERWEFWKKEFSRCIRCYACRNVCPACFCQRCFVEETEPKWVEPTANWQDNLLFQVVRNIHVAGRCSDCGECERACPVKIPLRALTREMYDIVGELFDFKTGMDKNEPSLMTHYEKEEAEGLIR